MVYFTTSTIHLCQNVNKYPSPMDGNSPFVLKNRCNLALRPFVAPAVRLAFPQRRSKRWDPRLVVVVVHLQAAARMFDNGKKNLMKFNLIKSSEKYLSSKKYLQLSSTIF